VIDPAQLAGQLFVGLLPLASGPLKASTALSSWVLPVPFSPMTMLMPGEKSMSSSVKAVKFLSCSW
jgi:hypothetical protein